MHTEHPDHQHSQTFNTWTVGIGRLLCQQILCPFGHGRMNIFLEPVDVSAEDPRGPQKAVEIVNERLCHGPEPFIYVQQGAPGIVFPGHAEIPPEGGPAVFFDLPMDAFQSRISIPTGEAIIRLMFQESARLWGHDWTRVHLKAQRSPRVMRRHPMTPIGDA